MKKILLLAIVAMSSIAFAAAQPRAIGVNLGYGIDLSYQQAIGDANMIDLSLNLPMFNGIGATATFDWINPFGTAIPWNNQGEWNWSLGVGAGAGIHGFKQSFWYAGVVAHVGVEYNFWFPLQLSIDWRPNIGIEGIGDAFGFYSRGIYMTGFSLGVRYLF